MDDEPCHLTHGQAPSQPMTLSMSSKPIGRAVTDRATYFKSLEIA
jgi:hypothetical protein